MEEQQLFFQEIFPLTFRVLSLFSLTLLVWASALHILRYCNLNPSQLLHPSSTPQQQVNNLHQPVYYASISLTLLILLGILINQLIHILQLLPPIHSQLISSLPAFALLILPFRLAPFSNHFRSSHRKLHATLRRIFIFNSNPSLLTPFSDIILADLLTSLARPFFHLAIFISTLLHLNHNLQLTFAIILNCLPYLLRLKQCVNDAIVGPSRMKSIMNGIKYTTAIPMILLSVQLRSNVRMNIMSKMNNHEKSGIGEINEESEEEEEMKMIRMWIITCVINTFYSAWWDAVNDWGIGWSEVISWWGQLRSQLTNQGELIPLNRHPHPHQHHQHQHVQGNNLVQPGRVLFDPTTWWGYIILVFLNFILRMTWIIGVFIGPKRVGIKLEYATQVLEVIRRGMWCVVRLEWAEMNRKKEQDYYVDLVSSSPNDSSSRHNHNNFNHLHQLDEKNSPLNPFLFDHSNGNPSPQVDLKSLLPLSFSSSSSSSSTNNPP